MARRVFFSYLLVATPFFLVQWIHYAGEQGRLPSQALHQHVHTPSLTLSGILTDQKFRWRGPQKPAANVVVVDVDSQSIETFGRWPWRRDLMAYLIDRTRILGARVIGMDILFSEPARYIPEELHNTLREKGLDPLIKQYHPDQLLRDVLDQSQKKVVMGWATETPCFARIDNRSDTCLLMQSKDGVEVPNAFSKFSIPREKTGESIDYQAIGFPSTAGVLSNLEEFNRVTRFQGFVNSFPDKDGIIRQTYLTMMVEDSLQPSLALSMVSAYKQKPISLSLDSHSNVHSIAISDASVAASPLSKVRINYRGGKQSFPYISAEEILLSEEFGEKSIEVKRIREVLNDSVVLIGVSAIAVGDIVSIPFDTNFPGVEVHANIVDNLLSGNFLRSTDYKPHIVLPLFAIFMLLIIPLLGVLGERNKLSVNLLSFIIGMLTLLLIDFEWLFKLNIDLNTYPLYLQAGFTFAFLSIRKIYWEEKKVLKARARLLEEKLAKAEMQKELETAQLMQTTLLTPPKQEFKSLSLKSFYSAATQCGGDIWGIFSTEDKIRFYIADATGHGAAAAIVTAVAKGGITAFTESSTQYMGRPDEWLTKLNEVIHDCCRGELLMTMNFVELDTKSGDLSFANAGHENPLWINRKSSSDLKVEMLSGRGEPLGLSRDSKYKSERFHLTPGDRLFFYTDGILDLKDSRGRELSQRRLTRLLKEAQASEFSDCYRNISEGLNLQEPPKHQKDDITFVVIQWDPQLNVMPLSKVISS